MAEFVRDEQDNVWFTFANKIVYRRKNNDEMKKTEEEDINAELKKRLDEKINLMAQELLEQEKANKSAEAETLSFFKMREYMDSYYSKMK